MDRINWGYILRALSYRIMRLEELIEEFKVDRMYEEQVSAFEYELGMAKEEYKKVLVRQQVNDGL